MIMIKNFYSELIFLFFLFKAPAAVEAPPTIEVPPIIETPTIANPEEEDRRVPMIQSKHFSDILLKLFLYRKSFS